jgi:hypothetical protein
MQDSGPPSFAAVPWLPPFRLGPRLLFDGVLEVTHAADALRPFSRLVPERERMAFRPADAEMIPAAPPPVPGDLSRPGRALRWQHGTARAAAEATAALARLGGAEGWVAAAAARRGAFLRAVDAGRPPRASALMEACREVPHAFRLLGNALPTEEAVRLLAPLGRLCEIGAGFGLFARALERAGATVAASDAAAGAGVGVAFPVRHGVDAAATLGVLREAGGAPPLLMMWPQPDEGDWFAEVFRAARPGQLVALASPEVEFLLAGGLGATTEEERAKAGPGWRAAPAFLALLADAFEEVAQAPVVAAGWPLAPTPLRLWRRRQDAGGRPRAASTVRSAPAS